MLLATLAGKLQRGNPSLYRRSGNHMENLAETVKRRARKALVPPQGGASFYIVMYENAIRDNPLTD